MGDVVEKVVEFFPFLDPVWEHVKGATFVELFGLWSCACTLVMFLLPIELCQGILRKGKSDDFSSLGLFIGGLITTLWFGYTMMIKDRLMSLLNGTGIAFQVFYSLFFYWYLTEKKYFHGQLLVSLITIGAIFFHVSSIADHELAVMQMGRCCSGAQIAATMASSYVIYSIIKAKTTEYTPFKMPFMGFFLSVQWLVFGFFQGDIYMISANAVGVLFGVTQLVLFMLYPPQTWRLPRFFPHRKSPIARPHRD